MRLALALQEAKDSAGAIAALERAAQIIPGANGANNPHAMIAKIALEQKDTARAIKALEAVMRVDHSDVESARKLAELVDPARRRRPHRGRLSPAGRDRSVRQPGRGALGRLALKRKDAATAVRSFRSALALEPARPRRRRTPISPRRYLAAGSVSPRPRSRRSRRSRSRRRSSARRTCC